MSIARSLARILRDQFQMHAAWMPVTTRFSLGDYGLWRDGVFAPLGNIAEFGVAPRIEDGREINFEFTSAHSSTTHVAAGAQVQVMPSVDVDAETRIQFSGDESFLLSAGTLTSTRIANIAEVARKLDETGRWRWQYKVVGELFVGEDVLLLATTERDTTITLRGKASALARLRGVKLDADVDITADKRLGLQIVGGSGPVGLGLFRARISGAPVVDFADDKNPGNLFVTGDGQIAEVVAESDWSDAPADDDPAE